MYALTTQDACKVGHQISTTDFEAGRKVLTDYLTGFEMGLDGTNGCKSSQPASKPVDPL